MNHSRFDLIGLYCRGMKRIPAAAYVADEKQYKKQQIVSDHAGPCRYKSHAQELGAKEGSHDAHQPHTDDIEDEWLLGLADTLHHAFHHNGESIKWF